MGQRFISNSLIHTQSHFHITKTPAMEKSPQQVFFFAFDALQSVTYSYTYPDSSSGSRRW